MKRRCRVRFSSRKKSSRYPSRESISISSSTFAGDRMRKLFPYSAGTVQKMQSYGQPLVASMVVKGERFANGLRYSRFSSGLRRGNGRLSSLVTRCRLPIRPGAQRDSWVSSAIAAALISPSRYLPTLAASAGTTHSGSPRTAKSACRSACSVLRVAYSPNTATAHPSCRTSRRKGASSCAVKVPMFVTTSEGCMRASSASVCSAVRPRAGASNKALSGI